MARTKAASETDIFTVELTEEERGKLQAVADYYGRMGAGACVRWMLVEKYDELEKKRAGQILPPSGDPALFYKQSALSDEAMREIIEKAVAGIQTPAASLRPSWWGEK